MQDLGVTKARPEQVKGGLESRLQTLAMAPSSQGYSLVGSRECSRSLELRGEE